MSATAVRKKITKSKLPVRRKAPAPLRRKLSLAARRQARISSGRPRAALNADADETLDAFVDWVNQKYQLQIPRLSNFQPGTTFYQMWSLDVEVTNNPKPGVVVEAKAKTSITIVAKVDSVVFMDIKQASIAGAG